MSNASADRLEELEIRLAYQDEMVEALNKTVTAQWTQIDALKREVARLSDRVQEAENRAGSPSPNEPPPPHY